MSSDKEVSRLISKSLDGSLRAEEASLVQERLAADDHSRAFAEISGVIQNSVCSLASLAEQGERSIAPGLSKDARKRLSDSISGEIAIAKKNSTGFYSDTGEVPDNRVTRVENEGSKVQDRHGSGSERKVSSRFTLLRKLGEGGLGNVWLARDENLKRNVAIKEMNFEALQAERSWVRFSREAEITGHLEHPNVVPLYQYGTDPKTGEPFYAMRFVGKRTLADAIQEYHERCDDGDCDPVILHRLLSAFQDVCQAIAYAHSRGVVHRDLKPENVALDNFGQVIVLDWGLAKLTEDGELGMQLSGSEHLTDSALLQTMAGEAVGTPAYMAPEQAAGDLYNVDFKTDIYGLGAILFSILTGSAPHANCLITGDKLTRSGLKDMLNAIAENATPRPGSIRPVPADLEATCVKAMARKKYARHDSASALADEVERWMVDQGDNKARYETMRTECRELLAGIQASVRDLESNVRFMSHLPPIQELIHVTDSGELGRWRERLASIFIGLLQAKREYRSIGYYKLEGDQFSELVRCKRHSTEFANVRKIPSSRLLSGTAGDYMMEVVNRNPEEVHTSFAGNALCDENASKYESTKLVSGVPVFDEESEELFGFVLIECDIDSVLRDSLAKRFSAADVVVGSDCGGVLMHANREAGIVEESTGRCFRQKFPVFKEALDFLESKLEYIDGRHHEVYGARLWLKHLADGIVILMSQKKVHALDEFG
ncbi:MAG: serine/threonine-protein kinase [Planctomycetota bacterium]